MGFKLLTLALAVSTGKPVVCNKSGEKAYVRASLKGHHVDFFLEYLDNKGIVPIIWGNDRQGRAANIPKEEEI